jgi:acyl-coenzyme A synthetase/AMP-(fatty) acid ligase
MNVADIITRHAHQRPWAVAIVEPDKIIHYRTLENAVWAAAAHVRRSGIAPGDVVGVSLPHSALYLIADYALARIGAVYLSLPLYDPLPVRTACAARFGVKWVLAADHAAGLAGVATVLLRADDVQPSPGPIPADLRFAGGDRPFFIRRTSGTTSEAKGIAITHRAALAEFEGQAACFPGSGDRYLAVVDMGMV